MKRSILAIACLAMLVATTRQVQAGVMVDFPSSSSTTTASSGTYFFNPTHTVFEEFSGTGLVSIDLLELILDVDFNSLRSGAFVNFDVFLNSSLVGNFTINDGDPLGTLDLDFAFPAITGGGTYTVLLGVTNTVPSGQGSVGFSEINSTATFGDAAVPEPTSLAIFGIGALVLVVSRRRQKVKMDLV